MVDPNKHGIYNKKGWDSGMSIGRMKQFTWLGIMIMNTGIWYSILTNGFFITITWVVILSAIVGIIIKLRENR